MTRKGKRVFTIAEAARELGISTNAIRKAIKSERLHARKSTYIVRRIITRTLTGLLISAKDLKTYRVSQRHRASGKKRGKN